MGYACEGEAWKAVGEVGSEAHVCSPILGADLRAAEGFNRQTHDPITRRTDSATTELEWAKPSEDHA